jgi:hypothetical protein
MVVIRGESLMKRRVSMRVNPPHRHWREVIARPVRNLPRERAIVVTPTV